MAAVPRVPGPPGAEGSVLVLNCGSSSVKFAVLDPGTGRRHLSGIAERLGTPQGRLEVVRGEDRTEQAMPGAAHVTVVAAVLGALSEQERAGLLGVGHRVVHGGARFTDAVLADDAVTGALRAMVDLAPLHMPANLAGIDAAGQAMPEHAQVAVFDTAFHHTLPAVAYRYAVPEAWYAEHGARRYGFHGLSHRYVAGEAARLLGRAEAKLHLVTLHLGNGASACAVAAGASIDTTMGLTPLEGLVMGTRSGDIDPGVLGHVAARTGLTLDAVLDTLNTASGLLGLSGLSNDMRTVVAAADQGHDGARLALDVYCYRAAKAVGALAVALGRLDAVVFTGGVGENAAAVRAGIMARLGLLGIAEDVAANQALPPGAAGRVSTPGPPVALVVPTDEELVIAKDTARIVTQARR
jgi:acetate kinase